MDIEFPPEVYFNKHDGLVYTSDGKKYDPTDTGMVIKNQAE